MEYLSLWLNNWKMAGKTWRSYRQFSSTTLNLLKFGLRTFPILPQFKVRNSSFLLPLIFGGNLPSKRSKRTWQCSEMVLFNFVFRLIFWNMYNLTRVVFIVTQQNVSNWWVRTQIWYALSSAKIILALIMLRFLENKGVFLTVNKLVRRVSHLLRPLSPVHEKDTDRNGVCFQFFAKLQLEMKSSTNNMWKIIFEFHIKNFYLGNSHLVYT